MSRRTLDAILADLLDRGRKGLAFDDRHVRAFSR